MLNYVTKNENQIAVMYGTNSYIGDLYREVDGYWVFAPETKGGYWSQEVMLALGNKLADMNKAWDTKIQRELGGVQPGGCAPPVY